VLLDVTITRDRNVIKKEVKNILKYKDLTTEIQCMWNIKTKVIPVITGANGTISESCINQRTTENSHIGQCTHIGKGLMSKQKSLNMVNSITCTINCNYRTTATLYTLEVWFVSGI
jgi:hypothetical protein